MSNFSRSEKSGLDNMAQSTLKVYSVGISTGGIAEIHMARMSPKRHIDASTIDIEGANFARTFINEEGLENQIKVKLEDVSKPLKYPNNYFDYIYARLVLHYLPKQKLDSTLKELRRILKPNAKIFVVVRSDKCPDALRTDSIYNPKTGLTTYTKVVRIGKATRESRYFHSKESIRIHMKNSGFKVEYVRSYNEQLYADFMRTKVSPHKDNLIEVLAEN